MRKLLYVVVALITFIIGFGVARIFDRPIIKNSVARHTCRRYSPAPKISYDSEAYAVYSAVIRDLYVNERTTQIVFAKTNDCHAANQSESTDNSFNWATQRLPSLQRDTLTHFNSSPNCLPLEGNLNLPVDYDVFTSDFDNPNFWTTFYKNYPHANGFIQLSAVGFNTDFSQAVVEAGYTCGGLCGSGQLVVLEKRDGYWRVVDRVKTWIS
jgi:hypothetical protein